MSTSALAAVIPMDVPLGWAPGDRDVNLVHALLYLGGVPLLLFLRKPKAAADGGGDAPLHLD